MLLEEWIDDDQRDTGHNDQRIFHQLYKILTLNKVLIILDKACVHLVQRQNAPQNKLQRESLLLGQSLQCATP